MKFNNKNCYLINGGKSFERKLKKDLSFNNLLFYLLLISFLAFYQFNKFYFINKDYDYKKNYNKNNISNNFTRFIQLSYQ